jgi:hypothetical protein
MGNFHFSGGEADNSHGDHTHKNIPVLELDFTHRIYRLSFGNDFPGMATPLDGVAAKHDSCTYLQYGPACPPHGTRQTHNPPLSSDGDALYDIDRPDRV